MNITFAPQKGLKFRTFRVLREHYYIHNAVLKAILTLPLEKCTIRVSSDFRTNKKSNEISEDTAEKILRYSSHTPKVLSNKQL